MALRLLLRGLQRLLLLRALRCRFPNAFGATRGASRHPPGPRRAPGRLAGGSAGACGVAARLLRLRCRALTATPAPFPPPAPPPPSRSARNGALRACFIYSFLRHPRQLRGRRDARSAQAPTGRRRSRTQASRRKGKRHKRRRSKGGGDVDEAPQVRPQPQACEPAASEKRANLRAPFRWKPTAPWSVDSPENTPPRERQRARSKGSCRKGLVAKPHQSKQRQQKRNKHRRSKGGGDLDEAPQVRAQSQAAQRRA